MKIRIKILSGFLVIVAMLTIAGSFGIYEFRKLSSSVESLLSDNYASIVACNDMIEGLERQESGLLLISIGKYEAGRKSVLTGDSLFSASLLTAKNNLTESNEDEYIKEINIHYSQFKEVWDMQLQNLEHSYDIDWYFNEGHQHFNLVKKAVQDLMTLNQNSMYKEATMLRDKAQRAVMPGFVAIIAALIFSLLFNYFINHYFVSPILRLTKAVKNYHPESTNDIDAHIETQDEILQLQSAVSELINKCNSKRS